MPIRSIRSMMHRPPQLSVGWCAICATGTMRTTYSVSPDCIGRAVYPYGPTLVSFISPDGSRFAYTITRGPGDRPTVISGWEIRVDP